MKSLILSLKYYACIIFGIIYKMAGVAAGPIRSAATNGAATPRAEQLVSGEGCRGKIRKLVGKMDGKTNFYANG